MKFILSALVLALTSASSFAASVESAKVIQDKDGANVLSIDVRYGGGCLEHDFELTIGACQETFPVRCQAELKDLTTDDHCRAIVTTTVEIPFANAGLDDKYYSGGILTISGSYGSKATVELPRAR